MNIEKPLGIIGLGNMGSMLANAWLNCGIKTIIVHDIDKEKCHGTTMVQVHSNREVAERASILMLAVKPNAMPGVLKDIRQAIQSHHLIISVAAGISIRSIADRLHPHSSIIRCMPNLPALVGKGATAICAHTSVTDKDLQLISSLFQVIGIVEIVEETHMKSITALSGSGPAYFAVMIEAMIDAGVSMGLPRDIASRFAYQTMLGSAAWLMKKKSHPSMLKELTMSPGGTTAAGMYALEQEGVRFGIMKAMQQAYERAAEVQQQFEKIDT